MTDLADVSPGDIITSARQNLINDYIQDGTHKTNTLSLDIGASECISSTKVWKGSWAGLCPIGGIIPWAKTITGVPALPACWQECDGSVISDAESPMNGQNTPNLNTTQRFLRGASTSGGTGGADTVAHTHDYSGTTASNANQQNFTSAGSTSAGTHTHAYSGTSGAASDANNLPAYYQVVYIIKIK